MPFLFFTRGVTAFGSLSSFSVVSVLSALLFVCRAAACSSSCCRPALTQGWTLLYLAPGSVSDPSIAVVSDNDAELVLECRSGGWFPEPELLWLDAEGNLLSAGPTETVRGSDDLYTVSSRVTVEKRHSSRYTCRVQQTDTNHNRETHLTLKYGSFLDPLDLLCSILIALVLLLGGSLATWFWCNRRKNPAVSVKPKENGGEQRFIQKNQTRFSAAFHPKDEEEQQFSP